MVDIGDTLALFLELQTLGDRTLRQLAFSHIVHSVGRMNQKHKNDPKNRTLQNVLFSLLQVCEQSSFSFHSKPINLVFMSVFNTM